MAKYSKKDIKRWENLIQSNGVQPDPKDPRDYKFSNTVAKLAPKAEALPPGKDLRYLNLQIEDQGHVGSCVANACVNAYEILLTKADKFYDLSRLFVYYIAREPYPALCCEDTGAYLRDGIKQVAIYGVCTSEAWPYIPSMVNFKPNEAAYRQAKDTKVNRYERIFGYGGFNEEEDYTTAIRETKLALLRGFPVPISMGLTRDFIRMPKKLSEQNYRGTFDGQRYGGHAMCIVGYDDNLGGFIVENSWGENWGDSGYFLLKYDVAFKDIWDAWVITGFKDIYFEDEFHYDRPFHNFNNLEIEIYEDEIVDGWAEMTTHVYGDFNPLRFDWHLDSFSLTDTILNHRDQRTCTIRKSTPGKSYGGYIVIKDSRGNMMVQPYNVTFKAGQNKITPFVKRLYEIILNREAEPAGLKYWVDELKAGNITGRDIVRSFFVQPEWTQMNYQAEETIKRVYRVMLGREPDPEGFNFWVDAWNRTGGDLTEITRGFSESEEFKKICADAGIRPF